MRSALVFGGSGQIGVPLIEQLLAQDWQVIAVSRMPRTDSGRLRWLRGDLQNVEGLPPQVDAIFSAGPLDHFSLWYANTPLVSPRVVAFGSTSLETKQTSEDASERNVAERLRAAETLVFETAQERRTSATVLRPTLVYGAGRDQTLSRIAGLARRSGFFVLPRSAQGLRQPVHVNDLATAARAVADAPVASGRSYELPGGETLGYTEMVERTLAALLPPARLIRLPDPVFTIALTGAHALGKMRSLNSAAVMRMRQDLVFELAPAHNDFGYSPRKFEPTDGMFSS